MKLVGIKKCGLRCQKSLRNRSLHCSVSHQTHNNGGIQKISVRTTRKCRTSFRPNHTRPNKSRHHADAVLEKHFFVTPPAEYLKPGVVWKAKRCLYGDKRAPRGWQDHFEKTMLELGFERLESEPGCFVKKGVTHKDTIIVVVHVDDLLSVGTRKHLDNFFVQLEKTLKLKRVEYITKFKDKITLKSRDTYVDNMLTLMGMESCKPTSTPMVRKESVANDD